MKTLATITVATKKVEVRVMRWQLSLTWVNGVVLRATRPYVGDNVTMHHWVTLSSKGLNVAPKWWQVRSNP